jgi:hypothetical protein
MFVTSARDHELQRPAAGCWLQFTVQRRACVVKPQRILESGATGPGIEVGSTCTPSMQDYTTLTLIRSCLSQCILRN